MEAGSRSLGSVLIFGLALGLTRFGLAAVAGVAAIFPLCGLIGTCCLAESSVYIAMNKRIQNESKESKGEQANWKQTVKHVSLQK